MPPSSSYHPREPNEAREGGSVTRRARRRALAREGSGSHPSLEASRPPRHGVKSSASILSAMGALRFGTSGWSYEEWLGVFYKTASESKLAAYGKVFNTAEIDSSFYRPPSKGMV